MIAGEQEPGIFPLVDLCLLSENSRPGHRLPIAVLHRGFAPVISNTATAFGALAYDFRVGPRYTYDIANRLVTAKVSSGTEKYLYGADNKRISTLTTFNSGSLPQQVIYIYGVAGELLSPVALGNPVSNNVYFSGRLIKAGTDFGSSQYADRNFVETDRLGSIRGTGMPTTGSTSYLPYGEAFAGIGQNQTSFATYYLNGSTGLHYADQRFYASSYGNFTTPDPSMDNVDYSNPGSWNAYAYVNGDPINLNDPSGLVACGDLINGQTGTSVNSILTTYNDLGYLAQTIWHEAGPVYTSDLSNINNFVTEQAYIATALENRYAIANGTLTAYTSTGGTVNPGVFGAPGTSLTNVILQAAGNNQSWGIYTNGQLNNMSTLQGILNTDVSVGTQVQLSSGNSVNTQCFAVLSAATEALLAQGGTRTEPNGVILAYWNLATNSSPASGTQTVTKVRPNGNTFYGYYSTQQPAPVRRSPPRRPPGREPRPL